MGAPSRLLRTGPRLRPPRSPGHLMISGHQLQLCRDWYPELTPHNGELEDLALQSHL